MIDINQLSMELDAMFTFFFYYVGWEPWDNSQMDTK